MPYWRADRRQHHRKSEKSGRGNSGFAWCKKSQRCNFDHHTDTYNELIENMVQNNFESRNFVALCQIFKLSQLFNKCENWDANHSRLCQLSWASAYVMLASRRFDADDSDDWIGITSMFEWVNLFSRFLVRPDFQNCLTSVEVQVFWSYFEWFLTKKMSGKKLSIRAQAVEPFLNSETFAVEETQRMVSRRAWAFQTMWISGNPQLTDAFYEPPLTQPRFRWLVSCPLSMLRK